MTNHQGRTRASRDRRRPLRAGSLAASIAVVASLVALPGMAQAAPQATAAVPNGPIALAAGPNGVGSIQPATDPVEVWAEDFENGQAATVTKLGDYTSSRGDTYGAYPYWLDYGVNCNGVIVSFDSNTPVASHGTPSYTTTDPNLGTLRYDYGIPSFPTGFCNSTTGSNGAYPQLNARRFADVLGQVGAGTGAKSSITLGDLRNAQTTSASTPATRSNHAVTAWTEDPGQNATNVTAVGSNGRNDWGPLVATSAVKNPQIMFTQAALKHAPLQAGYYTVSVDVAEASCTYSAARNTNSKIQFLLDLGDGTTADLSAGKPIEACKDSSTAWYVSPMVPDLPVLGTSSTGKLEASPDTTDVTTSALYSNYQNGGSGVRAGRYYTPQAVYLNAQQASQLGITMYNKTTSGNGNDFAYDNIRITQSTPTVNKVFGAESFPQGGTTSLTFTIVNTTENSAKPGWTWTDKLPAGLTFANSNFTTTCTNPSAPGNSGAAQVTFSGNDSIAVHGSLASGVASCTVTTTVTSNTVGEYTNDDTNMTRDGVLPTEPATVEVTPQVSLSIQKDVDLNWYVPGDTITYTVTVKNAASTEQPPISTATDAKVTDAIPANISGATWTCQPSAGASCGSGAGDIDDTVTIPAGGQLVYTIVGTVNADSTGSIHNVATVMPPIDTFDPNCQTGCSDDVTTPDASIQIIKKINGSDANTVETGPVVPVGSPMTIEYTVKNTGNTVLENVVVTDDKISPLGPDANLGTMQPGEEKSFTVTFPAPAEGGKIHTNLGTVVGTPDKPKVDGEDPTPVTDDDPANAKTPYEPAISLKKYINDDDADLAPGVKVDPGSDMTVKFVAANTGNVTLTNVVITDDKIANLPAACTIASLAPGAEFECTTTLKAPDNGGQLHTNTGTVTGMPPQNDLTPNVPPTPVTDDDPANSHTEYTPGIAIVKYIDGEDANTAPGVQVKAGGDMTVTFNITNTGNVPLSNVTLTDDVIPASEIPAECGRATLKVGEAYECTVTIKAPAEGGKIHTNVGTITGTPPQNELTPDVEPTPVTDDDPANAHTEYTPAIKIVKTINGDDANEAPGPQVAVGADMVVEFTVTNTGNVTLNDVAITDDVIGTLPAACAVPSLAPGASYTCKTTIKAPAEGGRIHTNVGTVVGTPPQNELTPDVEPTPVTDDDPANAHTPYTPSIEIVKSVNGDDANEAPGVWVEAGSTMVFRYIVKNTGNVTLTNVVVTDDKIANLPADCTVATLAPGESFTCEATAPAPKAGTQYTNVGTVVGTPPQNELTPDDDPKPVTDSDIANAKVKGEELSITGAQLPIAGGVAAVLLLGFGALMLARRRRQNA